jgi:hypothetical protein
MTDKILSVEEITAEHEAEKFAALAATPAPAVVSPRDDMVLVAKRRIVANGFVFDRGATVPVAALGSNFAAMIPLYADWRPKSLVTSAVQPRALSATSERSDAPIVLGEVEPSSGDLIVTRNRWVARVAKANKVSLERAHEALMYSNLSSDLMKRAGALESKAFAIKHKLNGRAPYVSPDFTNI